MRKSPDGWGLSRPPFSVHPGVFSARLLDVVGCNPLAKALLGSIKTFSRCAKRTRHSRSLPSLAAHMKASFEHPGSFRELR